MVTSTTPALRARPGTARHPMNAGKAALQVVLRWCRRHRDRRALAAMDDWLLRDIGLTRDQVQDESLKHFWQR